MKMSDPSQLPAQAAVAREYYVRLDAGRADVIDLFTDDVELYFPKFGIRRGKAAFGELGSSLLATVESVQHDMESLHCIQQDHIVVVEGLTHGRTKSGVRWQGGKTPGGRFCSIFRFRGDRIASMRIYLDPDYGSEDHDRFLWPEHPAREW